MSDELWADALREMVEGGASISDVMHAVQQIRAEAVTTELHSLVDALREARDRKGTVRSYKAALDWAIQQIEQTT